MLEALEFIHRQGIAYRDLKLENIMCTSTDDNCHCKLGMYASKPLNLIVVDCCCPLTVDFGLAKQFKAEKETSAAANFDKSGDVSSPLRTVCGSMGSVVRPHPIP